METKNSSHMIPQTNQQLAEAARVLLAEYITKADKLKAKERTLIPSQEMPVQDPLVRAHNLDEVAIGFTNEQARIEAMRCLQCVKQTCVDDCPVRIDIPNFIHHIAIGEFEDAVAII